jgi:dihydrofolate reductase
VWRSLRTTHAYPAVQIILVAAVAETNRLIGRGMELPWHLPEDLKHFKALTSGKTVLMGRRTYESILHQFGRPLPNRRNIVLTTTLNLPPPAEMYPGKEAALHALRDEEEIYVIGGSTVYASFLPLATRLELTLVGGEHEGDVFFPPYEHLVGTAFEQTREVPYPAAEGRPAFRICTFERMG